MPNRDPDEAPRKLKTWCKQDVRGAQGERTVHLLLCQTTARKADVSRLCRP